MSILFDAHDDPTQPQQNSKKGRSRNQDDRYSSSQPVDKFNDILVFGYQCKLFRDDNVATDVNSGKFLIPWMGNQDLMIDRYDCRGHLYRMEEFDFDNMGDFTPLSPERLDIENVCDEERYMELRNPISAEEEILLEEEDKRGSALYDPFTAYQNIEFSYENETNSSNTIEDSNFNNETYMQFCQYYGYDPKDSSIRTYFQSQSSYQYDYDRPPPPSEPHPTEPPKKELGQSSDATYEKFEPPEGIVIPNDMEVPETKKMQAIIEKTAMFISKQSAQMEIVLKTKQSGNPQFAFLDFDNYLNPYYKLILTRIKDGDYKGNNEKPDEHLEEQEEMSEETKKESDDDSDEDGDENELHPLLQAHRRPVNIATPSSPPKSPEIPDSEPIINPAVQTKTTGKIEDLAKVYMTWKYTQNPGETTDENKKDEEIENSLKGVQELPPPPLPPPPSFVLSQQPSDLDSSENNSLESIPFHNNQMFSTQTQEHPSRPMIEPPQFHHNRPRFDSSMLGPPPPHSLFSQIGYKPPPLSQPPHFYNFNSNQIPGNIMNNPFNPISHPIQYSQSPNLYQVRSSVPPPPPPPLPSLLPPGVDALPISSVSMDFNLETPKVIQSNESTNLEVYQNIHSSSVSGPPGPSSSNHDSLFPPGVDNDINSEKLAVPPPPLPPLLPNIEHIQQVSSNESDRIIVFDNISGETTDKRILDNIAHSPTNDSSECQDDLYPKENKKRRKSSKNRNNHSTDLQLPESSSQSYDSSASSSNSENSIIPFLTKIVTPGKDLQLVIDRLALYVAKNGDEFEIGIKEKKDPRFDFLNPWNIYHPYYANKKGGNLNQVTIEKKDEEGKKNSKVKFGLRLKSKPVSVGPKKSAIAAASVFNQNDDEEETAEAAAEGFQPNKDPEIEVKRKLQKQIEEKEKLLKQLQEQALLQQKIAEVNRQASVKPMLQHLTAEQQAILKKKVQENEHLKKDSDTNVKQDERKKRVASFVGMLKKNSETDQSSNLAGNFLRKRQFKETSSSKDSDSVAPDKANYEKKKDAFFKAINDAFKGT